MSWDVLWLVAGGFALGVGLQKTGLAAHLIGAIPFDTWPAFPLLVGCGIFFGLRISDLLRLTWHELLDEDTFIIHERKKKTGAWSGRIPTMH